MKFKAIHISHDEDFRIYAVQGYIGHIYFAVYPKKILMLDGGARPDAGIVFDFIEHTLKRSISDIKLIIVTHIHPDHIYCAQILQKKYGVKVGAAKRIDEWYKEFNGWIQHKIDIMLSTAVSWKMNRSFHNYFASHHVPIHYDLLDEDLLPLFQDWKIISTPGHTTHDLSVYHEKTGTLYVSDLIIRSKGNYYPPIPIAKPLCIENSLLKLDKLVVRNLLLAHGGYIKTNTFNNITHEVLNRLKTNNFSLINLFIKKISKFSKDIKTNIRC